jgi:hypothetical protein
MKEAREAGSNPSHQIIKHSHIALVSRHNNAVRLPSITAVFENLEKIQIFWRVFNF